MRNLLIAAAVQSGVHPHIERRQTGSEDLIVPFTPFYLGPGIFLKSLGLGYFLFFAFVAAQVVIDIDVS